MTRRLLLSYLGLAVLILVVLEIPLGVIAARHEHETAISQAQRDATGLAVGLEEDLEDGNTASTQSLLSAYHGRTGAETAVADLQGQIVARVDPDRDDDATTTNRAQIVNALRGQPASFVSSDEGHPIVVAAVPVGDPGHTVGALLLLVPAGAYTDHTQDIVLALSVFGVAVLALTCLIGLGLARSLSRPIAELQAVVSRLGEGQLASRAATTRGPPEMRTLAEQFNRMAEQLEELIAAQTRFVADASHQLRSPLTALRLRLENLEAELDPASGEGLAAAGREVQRLSRLVDGLLTLSRAHDSVPELKPVDVSDVIAERAEAWSALAAERRVSLVTTAEPDGAAPLAPLVQGDLEQILDNLLANALDASPSGTIIEVKLIARPRDLVRVHVVDDGPGMDEAERARAFDRFWQGSSQGGHSGLGLAIVRQLAQRNGVEVRLGPAAGGGLDAVVVLRPTAERVSGPVPAPAAT